MEVEVKIVHNASMMNAIEICSLICSYIFMEGPFQYPSLLTQQDHY
jgi:diphthamide biosynthesis methyltransferase